MADQDKFLEQSSLYMHALYAAAYRLTGNREDAEDLLQETILHAYRGYKSFEDGTNLRAWLYRILHNTFVNIYRYKQRRPKTTELEDIEDLYLYRRVPELNSHSDSSNPEDFVLNQITDEQVKNAIEQLPDSFKIPLLLSDIEGFSYQEIADILEIPLGTVMSRLHRARKHIQKALFEYARENKLISEIP